MPHSRFVDHLPLPLHDRELQTAEALSEEAVDRRADLYALGCVAYWLLTGEMVFEADNALQMVVQHLRAKPVPPSERIGRPAPPALERVVMGRLEKQPEARPPSVDEVLAELDRMEVGPSWDQERARTWWQTSVANEKVARPERSSLSVSAAPVAAVLRHEVEAAQVPRPFRAR